MRGLYLDLGMPPVVLWECERKTFIPCYKPLPSTLPQESSNVTRPYVHSAFWTVMLSLGSHS
jgi:hypothetical protein